MQKLEKLTLNELYMYLELSNKIIINKYYEESNLFTDDERRDISNLIPKIKTEIRKRILELAQK